MHRRKLYDTTGSLQDCEEMDSQEFGQLYKYYKDLYAFTTDDIDSFAVSGVRVKSMRLYKY